MRLASNFKEQLKNSLKMIGIGTGIFFGYCIYSGNVKFYHNILMPTTQTLVSPEKAHRLAVIMGKYNLFPKFSKEFSPNLKCKVFGLQFSHPIGMAAGFDKNCECPLHLLNLGFSHVEIGSVTPLPQSGNATPRIFRLCADEAIINRYGFNSDGHDVVYDRLKNINWKGKGIIGVNLGVNKTSKDPTQDYIKGVKLFGELADYLVINVSSPNTHGLRNLQKKESLTKMLKEILTSRDSLKKRTPLLLKISPDESDDDIKDIINVIMQPECRVDGLIVSNTTITRPNLKSPIELTSEQGGLSGKPLANKSTELIAHIASLTSYSIPIIGVGGVDSGLEAWKKLMAGASLIQLYTSFVYYGPPVVKKVVNELSEVLSTSKYDFLEEVTLRGDLKEDI